uniref:Uncharacterized protein n=1 Tax=Arundo donax TaxID=35708 RepID=A0A0A8Y187_ARUDO
MILHQYIFPRIRQCCNGNIKLSRQENSNVDMNSTIITLFSLC